MTPSPGDIDPHVLRVIWCALAAAGVLFAEVTIKDAIKSIREHKRAERAAKWFMQTRQWVRRGDDD
jgi:hypothetical protein